VDNKYHKTAEELPWGLRVRDMGTIERITIEEVKNMLDKLTSG